MDKKAEFLEKRFDEYQNAKGDRRKLTEQITAGLSTPQEKSRLYQLRHLGIPYDL